MPLSAMPNEWKLPLNLTVLFHIFVLFCAMILPGLLHRAPDLPEITTIDLVSMGEPAAAKNEPAAPPAAKPKAPPATPPKPAETIKPEAVKEVPPPVEKAVPVPESQPKPLPEPALPSEPVVPPAPAEAISIAPLKQKIKKEVKEEPDTRAEDAKKRLEELKDITNKLKEEAKKEELRKEASAQETIKQQRLQAAARENARQAEAEARRAEAEARMAAEDAKNALRNQLRASGNARNATAQTGAGSGQNMGVLEQQYYATIMGHIQQYWQPPDIKAWDANLLAQVSITIASDGRITSQSFERNSGDKVFDQFVLKTLEAANPLPAPPPALQKQKIEVGLRFKPSGIQ